MVILWAITNKKSIILQCFWKAVVMSLEKQPWTKRFLNPRKNGNTEIKMKGKKVVKISKENINSSEVGNERKYRELQNFEEFDG